MEKFRISVSRAGEVLWFEVINKHTDKCEYEVFDRNLLVAVFEPNEDEYIRVCRNPGGLDEEIIYSIAGEIEAHHL